MAVRERTPSVVTAARPKERWGRTVTAGVAVCVAIFVFYFAPYPIRHASLPAGFDPPWYIWRATFAGRAALGPVSTASRPGHEVLSALLGSVTGRSQLQLFVVFGLLLPAMVALGAGALATSLTGRGWRLWVVTAAVGGAVLGATRLVGENVANLLNVALEVGALIVLANAVGRRAALWASVALLVAAGLAHWVFLAVIEVALAVTVGLSLVGAERIEGRRSTRMRQEARLLTAVGAWAAGILGVVIVVVLRAPFRTFEIFQNPQEFAPKLITDVARLWPVGVAATLGLIAMRTVSQGVRDADEETARSLSGRMLMGWTIACGAGVLVGLVTLGIDRFSLPPHRFLGLLVAVPGVITGGIAVWWAANRVGWNVAGGAVVLCAAGLLAIPSVLRWYKYPILMRPAALQQAETAAGYVAQLPPGRPFVFVIDARGPAVVYDAPLRERMIRMALPPERQEDLHVFVGTPSDLLAGRRTDDTPLRDRVTEPYWKDVAPVLPRHPPVLVLQAMGQREFSEARSLGAPVIGSGVALLQGPEPVRALVERPPPDGVPALAVAVLWSLVLLGLLALAGLGWTALILGRSARPVIFVSLVPLVGTGVLLLGAFVATESGVRLHGLGGIATYVAVTLAGLGWAMVVSGRSSTTGERVTTAP